MTTLMFLRKVVLSFPVALIQEADRWFRAFIVNLSSETVVYRSFLGIVTWMKDTNRFQSFPII